ncbi:hypothetical protein LLS1_10230 [Leifsonia sp. LS1]|uniref:DUF1737 domain-containing protein n=1 Tax=unclassified Leifsonia TaxID=2663824 RepID=UPI001CBF0310|nr:MULTISPECIES: DUF1737 domain-containing protein [unclassified Leifsonia]UAJ81115.1 DUF1737 domain-containing protein [Leifsonia sp. ZF2019]GIT79354.1 hypothetical protein LLS1_10230 [Leifsonia sp. LS1]
MGSDENLPRYRLLTGVDDAAFCERVSAALDLGYELHGGPALTWNGATGYVAQAVVWHKDGPTPAKPRPGA